MKTVYIKDNKEYYYNADGKLVFRFADETKDYRLSELSENIKKLLDRARNKYNYPSKALIDNVISMSKFSEKKAENYIKYKLLGELKYIDVFGEAAETAYQAERHYKQADDMQAQINKMSEQLQDMQKILFNLAAEMNRKHFKAV